MTFDVKLDPDGTLEMTDASGRKHPFHRAGPERWEARISQYAKGSVRREGNQLVFRREPTENKPPPVKGKNGLMLTRRIMTIEDRLTRVPAGAAATQPGPTGTRAGLEPPLS